jgi:hypothetical protein
MGSHPRLPTADKTETPLSIDIVSDIRRLNDLSIKSKKAGMIILGGGVCKHQIANSMLFVRSSCSLSDSAPVLFPRRGGGDLVLMPTTFSPPRNSATAPISPSTSTRVKSSTGPTRARGRTRPSRGARSASTARASKSTPTRPSCSRSSSPGRGARRTGNG